MKLTYTAVLAATDASFNADGAVYTFTGSTVIGTAAPSAADLTTLANAMAADIIAQMIAKYPVQAAGDSGNAAAGGQG